MQSGYRLRPVAAAIVHENDRAGKDAFQNVIGNGVRPIHRQGAKPTYTLLLAVTWELSARRPFTRGCKVINSVVTVGVGVAVASATAVAAAVGVKDSSPKTSLP